MAAYRFGIFSRIGAGDATLRVWRHQELLVPSRLTSALCEP